MEFEEQFAIIQGSLITLKKKLGDLDMLSSEQDDILKTKNVAEALTYVIHDYNSNRKVEENDLRKMHMFLLLNTNLKVKGELEEDDNCGHIVGCAPIISKHLYLELVYSLALQKYACEAIVYAPFSLAAELLECTFLKYDALEFSERVVQASQYATAVYHKFRLLDSEDSGKKYDSAKLSLYKYFKKMLQVFQKASAAELPYDEIDELYNIAGLAMENLLGLFNNCLKLYINPTDVNFNHQDIYRLKLSECLKESSEETNITSESIINEVLNMCNSNFQAITVDMFLYWADCFIDREPVKSLQQSIRETMHYCAQNLKAAQEKGLSSNVAEQVMSALVSMGDKPPDEDDEIKEADLNLIIKNISDKTKTQNKWFKALVKYPVELSDDIYFKVLEQHLHFANIEDVKTIIEKIMTELNSSDITNKEALKNLALAGIKHLDIDEQLSTLDWFFLKYGVNTVLKKDDFSLEMVHIFNKSVHLLKEEMELVSEFIYMCLQSPYDVIARMIREGLLGTEQRVLMVKILKSLRIVENMYVINNGEIEYSKTEKKGSAIIMHNVHSIIEENLNDGERQCFIPLIALFVTHSLIDGVSFITEILLPHVHYAHGSNEEDLLFYLETLCELMNGDLLSGMKHLCPLLVFLGSLLERWNICTFTMRSVMICQNIQLLLKRIFKAYLDDKSEEDKEIIWLRHKLKGLAPLNKCYFKEAWKKFGRNWVTDQKSTEVILLELMLESPHRISDDITKSFGDTQNHCISFSLAKILPQCTPLEWKCLVRHLGQLYSNLSDSETGQLKVAGIFTDSLLMLIQFIDWENAHSCLDYCVRNIGIVIKEEILPKLDGSQPDTLMIIFQKVCYGLGLLPADVREQCCTVIVNILVDIVQKAADTATENILEDLPRTLGVLHDDKALQVLSNKLLALREKKDT